MSKLVDLVCERLRQNEALALARILDRRGSAPRTAGARMLIGGEGRIHGTIGGGLLEAYALEAGRRVLDQRRGEALTIALDHDQVSEMDMICGGRVEVLLDYIAATAANREIFSAWQRLIGERRPGIFVTLLEKAATTPRHHTHCLLGPDGVIHGECPLPGEVLARLRALERSPGGGTLMTLDLEDARVVVEPVYTPVNLFIFGAGHVSQPTARMAAMVGFQVVVLDDRAEFANTARFPEAAAVQLLPRFEGCLTDLMIDEKSYIVILTRGHLHDKTVLEQALRSRAGYIGMIGSRRKRDAIYRALGEEGFADRDLQRVFSPIGLGIDAETPEEIAVSIVAELIQQRARQL